MTLALNHAPALVRYQRRTLTVAQSLEQTKAGLRFKARETKGSRRIIALSWSLTEQSADARRQAGGGTVGVGIGA
jgi:hypothetical protein